jgi:1A family penicillin-binding protein
MPIPSLTIKNNSERPSAPTEWKNAGRVKKIISIIFLIFLLGFILAGIGGSAILLVVGKSLPDPDKIIERSIAQTTKIYDRTGENILYEIHGAQKRTLLELNQIASALIQATLISEDRDFYKHSGFDIRGILRAIYTDFVRGGKVQGGSTITQQLVKNAILTSEKTYTRKIKELILAYEIEKKFTKDQILKMYLNEIPYGSTLYGIEAASQSFFGISAKDLTIAEAAMLAAIPQAPSRYSPYGSHRDELLGRQRYIISEMEKAGKISKDEAEAARQEPVMSKLKPKQEAIVAPHFVMYVKDLLEQKYGEKTVEEGGLKVITSLDLDKQKIAEQAIENNVKNIENYGGSNAALVSLNPKTGEILAMVGSRDYFNNDIDGQVNVALAPRQPGSSFKPIVYAASFIKGYTPDTILYDVKTIFKTEIGKDYTPNNYDLKEHGPVTVKSALAGSLNIPAVKMIYLTGVGNVLDLAEKLGYTTFGDRSRFGLSLVLGGGEVKLLEHTAGFGAFATEGRKVVPISILKVEDSAGKILEEWKPAETEEIFNPEIARQITDILSNNNLRAYIFGSNNFLILPDRPVAAKTGTTNDYHDAWTLGYTPSLVTGVWVGNSDNKEMKRKADGSVVAAPIWNEYMKKSLEGTPVENFTSAASVKTGKPILDGVPTGGYFVKIDRASRKLATEYTPENFIEERVYGGAVHNILYYVNKDDPRGAAPADPAADSQYQNWEAGVQDWALRNGYGQTISGLPPTEYDDLHAPANRPEILWVNPIEGGRLSSRRVNLQISASSKRGVISRARYYLDNEFLGAASLAPFSLPLVIPKSFEKGFHTLKAEVFDDIDNRSEISININLAAEPADEMAFWISPADGAAIPSLPADLEVAINDPTVWRIDFYAISPSSTEPEFLGTATPAGGVVKISWKEAAAKGFYKLFFVLKSIFGGGEIPGQNITVEVK